MSISSFTAEDSFTVSSVNVGALIGPKGSNIKRLSRETGCHISVSARGDTVSSKLVMTLTDEQVVTVRGITTETVAAARVRIEHTTSTPRSSVSSPSSHKSVVESPRKEHPLAPSGAGVVLFDEWSDFLTSISKRNMKPTFKVHAPGCRCAKVNTCFYARPLKCFLVYKILTYSSCTLLLLRQLKYMWQCQHVSAAKVVL